MGGYFYFMSIDEQAQFAASLSDTSLVNVKSKFLFCSFDEISEFFNVKERMHIFSIADEVLIDCICCLLEKIVDNKFNSV